MRFVSLLLAGAMLPSAVSAQDLVVMRKVMTITVPDGGERQQPSAVEGYSWKTFAWQSPAGACGQTVQTRRVECVKGVQTVADAMCGDGRPAATRQLEDLKGCSYDWTLVSKGAWNSECSLTATRPLNYECRRSDGAKVDDGRCGSRPPATETGENVSQCTSWKTGEFGAYDSTCSTSAVRTRQVQCVITGGTVVPDSRCAGDKPATSETSDVTTGCQARWDTAEWGTWSSLCGNASRTRTVTCVRYGPSGQTYGGVTSETQCKETKPTTRETAIVTSTCASAITNGDFETCTGQGWKNGSGVAFDRIETASGAATTMTPITGKCSAYLVTNYYSNGWHRMSQDLTLIPGKTYRISFRHKTTDANGRAAIDYVGFGPDTLIEGTNLVNFTNTRYVLSGPTAQRMTIEAVATASAGRINIQNGSQGGFLVDDVSVTEVPN